MLVLLQPVSPRVSTKKSFLIFEIVVLPYKVATPIALGAFSADFLSLAEKLEEFRRQVWLLFRERSLHTRMFRDPLREGVTD